VSGWRRSVCDCGCGDPSICEGGGCGRCLSDETTDPNVSCGEGTACPATYAVTVNVPSITLEKGVTVAGCNPITFSSFSASGVLTRDPDPPSWTGCRWGDSSGSGEYQFLGTGGGSQTISGCSACPDGVTIDYIGVWCKVAFGEVQIGGVRGRSIGSQVVLDPYYDGSYQGGCNILQFWAESGTTSPVFISGCGCLNGYTGEFTATAQPCSNICSTWVTKVNHPTITWAIT